MPKDHNGPKTLATPSWPWIVHTLIVSLVLVDANYNSFTQTLVPRAAAQVGVLQRLWYLSIYGRRYCWPFWSITTSTQWPVITVYSNYERPRLRSGSGWTSTITLIFKVFFPFFLGNMLKVQIHLQKWRRQATTRNLYRRYYAIFMLLWTRVSTVAVHESRG